jgi:hypothetical protein
VVNHRGNIHAQGKCRQVQTRKATTMLTPTYTAALVLAWLAADGGRLKLWLRRGESAWNPAAPSPAASVFRGPIELNYRSHPDGAVASFVLPGGGMA